MAASNFNIEDPSKQEQIRRGHHEYIPTAGKHGAYIPKPYKHQDYPKMMLDLPQPQLKEFQKTKAGVIIPQDQALNNWQLAVQEWDRQMTASIVHNAEEEAQWKRKNG